MACCGGLRIIGIIIATLMRKRMCTHQKKGLWGSHIGWVVSQKSSGTRVDHVPDLMAYPELRMLNKYWIIPGALLPVSLFVLGGWPALYWGFVVSTVLLWHGTFTVNSTFSSVHIIHFRYLYSICRLLTTGSADLRALYKPMGCSNEILFNSWCCNPPHDSPNIFGLSKPPGDAGCQEMGYTRWCDNESVVDQKKPPKNSMMILRDM